MRHPTGLSATLFPNYNVEPYSPKGPENVNITTLNRCAGATRLLWSLNYLKKRSLRNTASKDWKQQTRFYWVLIKWKTNDVDKIGPWHKYPIMANQKMFFRISLMSNFHVCVQLNKVSNFINLLVVLFWNAIVWLKNKYKVLLTTNICFKVHSKCFSVSVYSSLYQGIYDKK